MKYLAIGLAGVTSLLNLGGCDRAPDTAPTSRIGSDGAQVAVTVAALELKDVGDASYRIEVFSGDPDSGGERVVARPGLRSQVYGDGAGSLTYVAPCDASGGGNGYVRLTLESLTDSDGQVVPEATWQNPTPVTQQVGCAENSDTPVTFNITIMRDAQQGFFDVAVNFTDIFCSAKFDCKDDDGVSDITLLHNPDGGARETTMVLAFACATGDTTQSTWLHMSEAHVECQDGGQTHSFWLSTAQGVNGLGNQGEVAPNFFQTGLYMGENATPAGPGCYWNMAFGLDAASAMSDCTLVLDATASDSSWSDNGSFSPKNTTYPYVHYEIPFTDSGGALSCGNHGLDSDDGRVTTTYTDLSGEAFPYQWECGTPPPDTGDKTTIACSANVAGYGAVDATLTQSAAGITAAFGANRGPAYALPDGLSLGGCCLNPCCEQ